MEVASPRWLSEWALMEDQEIHDFTYQDPMSPIGYCSIDNQEPWFNGAQSLNDSAVSNTETPQTNNVDLVSNNTYERPQKQHKANSWNSSTTAPSSSSRIISFENPDSSPALNSDLHCLDVPLIRSKTELGLEGSWSYGDADNKGNKRPSGAKSRNPSHAQGHVMAERKRRENLTRRFIALSAIIPGLKKMDKASVLGSAIKYLKQLQERVKELEEDEKRNIESVVFVKKTQVYDQEESSSTEELHDGTDSNNGYIQDHPLPEIEARVSGTDVLLRVHCEKQKNCVTNLISEIEKCNFNVFHSSVLQFGNSTFDITIIAQRDVNFSMTMKDLVKNLRQSLSGKTN